MKIHWKTEHADAFIAHDELYADLVKQGLPLQKEAEPCTFCAKATKSVHHDCMLLRNLAMLGASNDLQDRPIHSTPDRLFPCSHCDRKFLTHNGLQMHLQKKHEMDCKGSIAFIVERDCLPRATACAHCGTAFNCMSSLERHIRGGKCKEFNPDLPVCTLLSTHDRLRELVTQDKLADILLDEELKELLYLTCGLCQQTFRYRGSLGNHFVSRHASVVSAARFSVLDLETKHRGRGLKCFCPNGHESKSRAHRCVIFQQYAMLRHYVITSNQAIAPLTPDPTADMLVTQMGDLLDADTDIDNDDMDVTTDADLALLLQEQMTSQEASTRSRTDTTTQVVADSDVSPDIDPAALPFMDLPSYSTSLRLNDNVMDYLHDSTLLNVPTAIYHIAKGDYLALWHDVAALHFMSRNCVCCNESFSFDEAASHISMHWSHITMLPSQAYTECAEKFMQNFRILPWFQNIPCYQAILHQILLVRLLVELWSNGPGRHRDVGDLERNLASQRIAEGLQTASFTGRQVQEQIKHPTTSGPTSGRSRSRSRGARTLESHCPSHSPARGHSGSALATESVHLAHESRTGQSSAFDDGQESKLACRKSQDNIIEELSGIIDDGYTDRTKLLSAQKGEELHMGGLARHILTEDGKCPYLAWHPQQRRLIPSKDPPLEASALLQILAEIREHLKDQTSVLRFHSLRKLAADAELQAEAVYPWLLTVSPALHASMAKISYHSAWQLVSIDLKRQTATRSPLAKQIATSMAKRDRWEYASTSRVFSAG